MTTSPVSLVTKWCLMPQYSQYLVCGLGWVTQAAWHINRSKPNKEQALQGQYPSLVIARFFVLSRDGVLRSGLFWIPRSILRSILVWLHTAICFDSLNPTSKLRLQVCHISNSAVSSCWQLWVGLPVNPAMQYGDMLALQWWCFLSNSRGHSCF
jgi:hypothetical protein